MRTVSANWEANQLEDAACPSRLNAFIETRTTDTPLTQLSGGLSVEHPSSWPTTAAVGQTFTFDRPFVIEELIFKLSLVDWTSGSTEDLGLYAYDSVDEEIGTLLGTAQLTGIDGDFEASEKTFTMAEPVVVTGEVAALLMAVGSGTLSVYYALGDRYEDGTRILWESATAPAVTPYATDDLYFKIVGQYVDTAKTHRWRISNDPAIDNAVEATITSIFDPTGATLPIESCSLTIENAKR